MRNFLLVFFAIFPILLFSKNNGNSFYITTDQGTKLKFQVVSEDNKEVELARGSYNGKSYVIPQNVTFNGVTYTVVGIGDKAFYERDHLRNIELPKTIRYIGENAFEDARFKEFIFPESLKSVKKGAFNNTILRWKEDEVSLLMSKRFMHPLIQGAYRLYKYDPEQDFHFRNEVTGDIKYADFSDNDYGYKSLLQKLFREYEGRTKDSISYHTYYVPVLNKVERTNDPEYRYSGISEVDPTSIENFDSDIIGVFSGFEDDNVELIIGGVSPKYYFLVKNKTSNTLKIVWDDAVFVDIDGTVSKVMHNGVKYSEKENSQPSTSIIKNSSLSDEIIPTHFVRLRDEKWVAEDNYPEEGLSNDMVRIMLPIQIKDVVNEYIFEFSLEKRVKEKIHKVVLTPYYRKESK